ncbi:MAG: MOSC domain-containing protein [Ilumatobacteraceae bacterium]
MDEATEDHRTPDELAAGTVAIAASPVGAGRLELIVRRPRIGEREVVDTAQLDVAIGLVGDTWADRPSTRTPDRSPHPGMQLNMMNARAIELIAGSRARWPLAGDQLFVDLHLGPAELPPGTRLRVGEAVIEVTDVPHRGCAKFTRRFGLAAMRFVNSEVGTRLNVRGVNAKVVVTGTIRTGDEISALPPAATRPCR